MISYLSSNPLLILLIMIFAHIVDDYYLQGILASMKQKSWWRKQEGYSDKYCSDYTTALFMHSFSWAFMINLIFMLLQISSLFVFWSITLNTAIHLFVDDAKANRKKLNLVQDQSIHMVQIVLTFILYMFIRPVI